MKSVARKLPYNEWKIYGATLTATNKKVHFVFNFLLLQSGLFLKRNEEVQLLCAFPPNLFIFFVTF